MFHTGEQPDVSGPAQWHRLHQNPVLRYDWPSVGPPLRAVPCPAAPLPTRFHPQHSHRGVPRSDIHVTHHHVQAHVIAIIHVMAIQLQTSTQVFTHCRKLPLGGADFCWSLELTLLIPLGPHILMPNIWQRGVKQRVRYADYCRENEGKMN